MELPKALITEKQIEEKITLLGKIITKDFENKNLTIICVTKGSILFMADLMRQINMPCKIDFIGASSYEDTESTGKVKINFASKNKDFSNENILIVDDILDTGKTLSRIISYIHEKLKPIDIKTCVLLDKPSRRVVDINSDYVGFEIPNKFVIGYGLDYNEHYRNLPYIGILK